MERLTDSRIQEIADARGISYEPIADEDPLVVRTRMWCELPIDQEVLFTLFSNPVNHVSLFAIIKGSTPAIRTGIDEQLGENQFFALEHVEEASLPPRIMFLKYTLDPPARITKEIAADPFNDNSPLLGDRKRGSISFDFEKTNDGVTKVISESTFHTATGAVFARGFIDHVWLNFFERLMVLNRIIAPSDVLTGGAQET